VVVVVVLLLDSLAAGAAEASEAGGVVAPASDDGAVVLLPESDAAGGFTMVVLFSVEGALEPAGGVTIVVSLSPAGVAGVSVRCSHATQRDAAVRARRSFFMWMLMGNWTVRQVKANTPTRGEPRLPLLS
jgi:hypothetical protein